MTLSIKWNIVDFTKNNILAGMFSCAFWGWRWRQIWKLFVQKNNTYAYDKYMYMDGEHVTNRVHDLYRQAKSPSYRTFWNSLKKTGIILD